MIGLELDNFEAWAIMVKESKSEVLIDEMCMAHFAITHDQAYRDEDPSPRLARWLAHLWGQSTVHSVNVLAQMYIIFDDDDILPDAPLSLYKAVMETDNPHYALRLATDYEFRQQELGEEYAKTDKKGIWSSSDLRRFYDIKKGRHYASDKIEANVEITAWDTATGDFAATGMPLSGEPPKTARVTVREVLQK